MKKVKAASEGTLYQDVISMLEKSGRLDMLNELAQNKNMTVPDLIVDLVDDVIDVWYDAMDEDADFNQEASKKTKQSTLNKVVANLLQKGWSEKQIKAYLLKRAERSVWKSSEYEEAYGATQTLSNLLDFLSAQHPGTFDQYETWLATLQKEIESVGTELRK